MDNTNPLFISIGNPGTYSKLFTFINGQVFKAQHRKEPVLVEFYQDSGHQKTTCPMPLSLREQDTLLGGGVAIQKGTQFSRPVNLDGYWNVMNNTTYSTMISKIKSNLNTSLNLRYQRLPGITNDELNIANAYTAGLRIALVSNISEKIDFNVYYNVNGNWVVNSIQSNSNSSYITQTTGAKLNWMFGNGFCL